MRLTLFGGMAGQAISYHQRPSASAVEAEAEREKARAFPFAVSGLDQTRHNSSRLQPQPSYFSLFA